jgi:hypothetical protein
MSDDIVRRLRQQAIVAAKKFGGAADIRIEWKAAAEIERMRARVEALEKTLKHAASVSHNGGLVGFSEHDALIAVRRLTLAYWGREHGEAARATVIAALEARP